LDSVGSNFDFGSGVDTLLGSTEVSDLLVVQITANTAQLVLQQEAGFNGNAFTVKLQVQVELGSIEVDNTVLRSVEFKDNFIKFITDDLLHVLLEMDVGSIDLDLDVTQVGRVLVSRNQQNFSLVQEDLEFLDLAVLDGASEDSESEFRRAITSDQVEAVIHLQGKRAVIEGAEPALFKLTLGDKAVSRQSFKTHHEVAFTKDNGEEMFQRLRNADMLEGNGFIGLVEDDVKSIDGFVKDKADKDFTVFTKHGKSRSEAFIVSQVGPEESLKSFSELDFNKLDHGRSVDVFKLEVNFIKGLGKEKSFFASLGSKGTRNLLFNKLLASLGNRGFKTVNLLLGRNLRGTEHLDHGFFTVLAKSNDILELEVHVHAADHVNIPERNNRDLSMAINANLLNHRLGKRFTLKEHVPLLLHVDISTSSKDKLVREGVRTRSLEHGLEEESETNTRSELKLFNDLLEQILAYRVNLFSNGMVFNFIGEKLLIKDPLSLEFFNRLDTDVVILGFFSDLLGDESKAEDHFNFLGNRGGRVILKAVSVVAHRRSAFFRNGRIHEEAKHVEGVVVVHLGNLHNVSHVKVASFSFNNALESQTKRSSEGKFNSSNRLDGLDGLEGRNHGDGLERVDILLSSEGEGLVIEDVNGLGGNIRLKVDHDLVGDSIKHDVSPGRKVEDEVFLDTSDKHFLGDRAESTDNSIEVVDGHELSINDDDRLLNIALNFNEALKRKSDRHLSFNDDGEAHIRRNQEFRRSNVHDALDIDGMNTANLAHLVDRVLQKRSDLFMDELVSDVADGAKEGDVIIQVQVDKAGKRTILTDFNLELINNLSPFFVKLLLDLEDMLFQAEVLQFHLLFNSGMMGDRTFMMERHLLVVLLESSFFFFKVTEASFREVLPAHVVDLLFFFREVFNFSFTQVFRFISI